MMNILRQAQDERVNELYTFVVSLRAFVVSLRTLRVSELEDAPVVSELVDVRGELVEPLPLS